VIAQQAHTLEHRGATLFLSILFIGPVPVMLVVDEVSTAIMRIEKRI
jgi:hypothetical protein